MQLLNMLRQVHTTKSSYHEKSVYNADLFVVSVIVLRVFDYQLYGRDLNLYMFSFDL